LTYYTFQESELTTIKDKLNKWQEEPDISILTDKLYEEAAYGQIINQFYLSNFPKNAQYAMVIFNGHEFADCMETTVRNLCNIILYNQPSGSFALSQAPTDKLDPTFASFYLTNSNVTNLEKKSVHQAWTNVIENRPWVTYDKIIDQTGLTIQAPEDTNGFIIIPDHLKEQLQTDGNKVKIADRWYIPINGIDEKGFEVQPSVRNIIILLNQFFGLNLFENIETDFLKVNFNKLYLPKMTNEFSRLTNSSYDHKTIDINDYTTNAIIISFNEFSLNLRSEHGELKIDYQAQNISDLTPLLIINILASSDILQNYLPMQLISIYPLSIEQFFRLSRKSSDYISFAFYLNLTDSATLIDLFTDLVWRHAETKNIKKKKMCAAFSQTILKDLTMRPDFVYVAQALRSLPKPLDPLIGNFLVEQANKLISKNKHSSLQIFFTLMNKKYKPAYEPALNAAQSYITSLDSNLVYLSLTLLHKLVNNESVPAYESALAAAQTFMISPNSELKELSNKIFDGLKNAAQKLLNSNEPNAKKKADKLLQKIQEQQSKTTSSAP